MRSFISILVLLALSPAWGQGRSNPEPEATKKTVAMSERVYEKLQQVQKHVEVGQYDQAHQMLGQVAQLDGLTGYENAQIWNLDGYSWYLQQNYPEAIRSYRKITGYDNLPEALLQSTLKTLAQLYFTVEDYQQALATAQKLIQITPEPSSDTYMLLGQSQFQLKEYKQAVVSIEKAIAIQASRGEQPEENQLLLLRAVHYELKDYQAMLAVLMDLMRLYPDDSHTLTIAGIYSELGETKKQLTLIEALYEKGALDAARYALNLANLYLLHGAPYKAANLLDKEIKAGNIEHSERNLRLLSQAWYQAGEYQKSLPPLKSAADLADGGDLHVRLGQAYSNLGRWQEAVAALEQALQRGGLKSLDKVRVMLGVALFNQSRFKAAAAAFRQVETDQQSKKIASQWLAHIEAEQQRRSILEDAINKQTQTGGEAVLDPS